VLAQLLRSPTTNSLQNYFVLSIVTIGWSVPSQPSVGPCTGVALSGVLFSVHKCTPIPRGSPKIAEALVSSYQQQDYCFSSLLAKPLPILRGRKPLEFFRHLTCRSCKDPERLMPSTKRPHQLSPEQKLPATQGLNRRDLMKAAALSSGALMSGAAGSLYAKTGGFAKPNKSGIEHIVRLDGQPSAAISLP
jgi:hypothetical protein